MLRASTRPATRVEEATRNQRRGGAPRPANRARGRAFTERYAARVHGDLERGSRARSGAGAPLALAAVTAVLLAAAAVRLVAAVQKSLVLDEFHTWFHATRPSVGAFFETLRLDNHPPLGFAAVALARDLFGSAELALRTPALLFGLAELALVAWFAARTLGRPRALAALALLAASSLHVDFSSQARMYALHALAATVTLIAGHALLTGERASRRAQGWLAVSLAAAFHTHYFGGQYVLGYGLAALGLAASDRALRARLARFALPVAAATLVSLPWALTGFRAQFAHHLPPGGDDTTLAGLAEAFVHLFFLNVRLGGDALRLAFIAGGGVVLLLGALGAWALVRGRPQRPLGVLLAVGAFGVPTLAWALAGLSPRLGFTWHYILPSAAPLALLAAVGASAGAHVASRAVRGGAWAVALGLAVTLTALNVATSGTEDFRGAVAYLVAQFEPGDAVICVEWQPALFPQGQPYDYYAPRLSAAPPARLPCRNFTLTDPAALATAGRVLVLRKSLPPEQDLWRLLQERFELVETTSFGFALDVTLWRRR